MVLDETNKANASLRLLGEASTHYQSAAACSTQAPLIKGEAMPHVGFSCAHYERRLPFRVLVAVLLAVSAGLSCEAAVPGYTIIDLTPNLAAGMSSYGTGINAQGMTVGLQARTDGAAVGAFVSSGGDLTWIPYQAGVGSPAAAA